MIQLSRAHCKALSIHSYHLICVNAVATDISQEKITQLLKKALPSAEPLALSGISWCNINTTGLHYKKDGNVYFCILQCCGSAAQHYVAGCVIWPSSSSRLSVVYVRPRPEGWNCGIWVTYFRVFLVVMLLCPDPSSHQMVTDGVRQGEVVVALRCNITVLNQSEVQMAIKIGLEVCDVFNPGETSHGNLLPLLLVCQWLGHLVDCYIIRGLAHQGYSVRDASCVCCDARHCDLQRMLQGQARSLAAHTPSIDMATLHLKAGRVIIH